ncbi:unnamed protein product, partial [Meganyctiphanes norvegica]
VKSFFNDVGLSNHIDYPSPTVTCENSGKEPLGGILGHLKKNVDPEFEKNNGFKPSLDNFPKQMDKFDISKINFSEIQSSIQSLLKDLPLEDDVSGSDTQINFLSNVGRLFDFVPLLADVKSSSFATVACSACKAVAEAAQENADRPAPRDVTLAAMTKVCPWLEFFNIETQRVCDGLINLYIDEIMYIIRKLVISPAELCGLLLGPECGTPYNPYEDWQITLPDVPKPPVTPPVQPDVSNPRIKVLQISDIHFDPYYEEGSNSKCFEPLCCRTTSGTLKNSTHAAGRWGNYGRCDIPQRTLENMLQHIAQTHPDITYIMWTGDVPPHDIWNQTRQSNLDILENTVYLLRYYFPNTPIFPALGNHESAPVNSFPPPFVNGNSSVDYLYKELSRHWLHWLPNHTSSTIDKGAFYSVLIKPGFRIISLNMNFCNNLNWWLLVNSTDPAQELQWLVFELQGAEERGEVVHILGHIPPGKWDCLQVWSANYYTIVNRYESTITGQFFGHTHYDEFELFFDSREPHRATSIAYIAPSVTTYVGLNPGYRIYTIEGDYEDSRKMVLDHATWVMDLNTANNRNSSPKWYHLYSAKADYNMGNLSPLEWDNLVTRMIQDPDTFDKFYGHFWKNSPVRHPCDKVCKHNILCQLRSGSFDAITGNCHKIR